MKSIQIRSGIDNSCCILGLFLNPQHKLHQTKQSSQNIKTSMRAITVHIYSESSFLYTGVLDLQVNTLKLDLRHNSLH